ncbi:MAG TPA: DUF2147 domain-containing protein [Mucilaginibacter sp.]
MNIMNPSLSCITTLLLSCFLHFFNATAQTGRERICGKWESEQHNLRISIYMDKDQFKAKIIWFSDTEGKPMDYWRDVRNPDPKLRSRKILGMSILSGLRYDPENDSWEDGSVYDSRHGRYWNAAAKIGKKGLLHVRGYWHFKFLGKTITFYRIR